MFIAMPTHSRLAVCEHSTQVAQRTIRAMHVRQAALHHSRATHLPGRPQLSRVTAGEVGKSLSQGRLHLALPRLPLPRLPARRASQCRQRGRLRAVTATGLPQSLGEHQEHAEASGAVGHGQGAVEQACRQQGSSSSVMVQGVQGAAARQAESTHTTATARKCRLAPKQAAQGVLQGGLLQQPCMHACRGRRKQHTNQGAAKHACQRQHQMYTNHQLSTRAKPPPEEAPNRYSLASCSRRLCWACRRSYADATRPSRAATSFRSCQAGLVTTAQQGGGGRERRQNPRAACVDEGSRHRTACWARSSSARWA